MKLTSLLPLLALLTLASTIARASETYSKTFLGYFGEDKRIQPMRTLIRAIEQRPKCNVFILNFQVQGASTTNKVRVRYLRDSRQLYLLNEDLGWRWRLDLYRQVSLKKLKQVYALKPSRNYWTPLDRFDRLEKIGCPRKMLYLRREAS